MPDRARVILITGASSGIGEATARRAVSDGYRVALVARSADRLDELATELGGPDHALAVPCDVTEWAGQERAVARTLQAFGRLDVAFANAGLGAARGFANESPEHWRAMVLTNVLGVALTIRASMTALREARGHLVLTGSVSGRHALPGSVYSATKAAVRALGESARQELGAAGVRVTVIQPGTVDTAFFDNPQADGLHPDHVAGAVLFALGQPAQVDVNEILLRPLAQSYP